MTTHTVSGTGLLADHSGNLYDCDLAGSFEAALRAEHGDVIVKLNVQHDDDGLAFWLTTTLDARRAQATFEAFRMDAEDGRGAWWEILAEDVEVD